MSIERLVRFVLSKAPHWLLDIIEGMIARDSAIVRVVKARAAAGMAVPDPALPDEGVEVRLLIAPFNYAGQAWEWAQSLNRSSPSISAQNLTVVFPNDLGFASSARVPAAVFAGSREWRERQKEAYAHYSHVMIESFTSTLGQGRGRGLEREIDWHLQEGREVAFLCHGTDVRSPRAHRERNAHSPFGEPDRAMERIERRAAENRRVMRTFDLPVFYSTPDLVHDVPEGTWLPLVVETERWEHAASVSGIRPGDRAAPVVLHAPTSAKVKGTAAVERAVASLRSAVEYRPLSGVPAAEMPQHIAGADIVIDQLLLGSYGVAACEAMAAGRVVVGNVAHDVRQAVLERFGLELPIVQADPDSIAAVLERLASDRAEREETALRGPAFVRAVHGGDQTLETLRDFLST